MITPEKIIAIIFLYVLVGLCCAALVGEEATGALNSFKKKTQGFLLLFMPIAWPLIILGLLLYWALSSYFKNLTEKFS